MRSHRQEGSYAWRPPTSPWRGTWTFASGRSRVGWRARWLFKWPEVPRARFTRSRSMHRVFRMRRERHGCRVEHWFAGGARLSCHVRTYVRCCTALVHETTHFHGRASLPTGLAYLHSKAIIHRDVKPANTLMFFDGVPSEDFLHTFLSTRRPCYVCTYVSGRTGVEDVWCRTVSCGGYGRTPYICAYVRT